MLCWGGALGECFQKTLFIYELQRSYPKHLIDIVAYELVKCGATSRPFESALCHGAGAL